MQPRSNQRDAARAVILPLDCSRGTLEQLFAAEPQATLSNKRNFREYLRAAHNKLNIDPIPSTGATEIRELGTFAALTALRIQRADPLKGTEYEAREPPGSAESRMLRRPLWKHPGLTNFCRYARNYYISTITWLFENKFPPDLQAEFAAVLLARDPPDTSRQAPYRTYANTDAETIHHRFRERTEVTEDHVWIDGDHISRCCQLFPCISDFVPSTIERVPRLSIEKRGLTIPREVFRLKFAEYAWHGWARLVHLAYQSIADRNLEQFVSDTGAAGNPIYERFRRNNPIYRPYFATDSENPQREWRRKSTTSKPLQIEDKRLITAVDCIRANPGLSFGEPISIEDLYKKLKIYFPPPRRPGNDVTTRTKLIQALGDAESNRIKLLSHDRTSKLYCELPAPEVTPIHPPYVESDFFWDTYLRLHSEQRLATPERKRAKNTHGHSLVVESALPDETWRDIGESYERAVNESQITAGRVQSTVPSIHDVKPVRNLSSSHALTADEEIFLTRIGLAMERKIADFSLTDSMRPLRKRSDGTDLNVDETKLKKLDWVERHPEGQGVLYTVPESKREMLGIENVSNDGYGERTTSEKSLHRKGIDCCAAAFASRPEVSSVVRYYDLWRLRSTICEPVLDQHNLLSKRIDVLAFDGLTPKYVAEVETKSNSRARTQGCIDKLAAFTDIDGITTSLVVPNGKHLWDLMCHLDEPDYFDFDSFPNSSRDKYGRSNWESKLRKEGVHGDFFNRMETFRTLAQESSDSDTKSYSRRIVGNS